MAAPIPMPVSAASESGVSNPRPPPNCSKAPRVVPKMPLGSSTPTPITKIRSSLAMAWRVASSMASRYLSVRMRTVSLLHVRVERGRLGEWARLGEGHRVGYLGLDLRIESLAALGGQHPRALEAPRQGRHRRAPHPRTPL